MIEYEDASNEWSTRLTKLGAMLDAGDYAIDMHSPESPIWTPMIWTTTQRRKQVLEDHAKA